MDNILWKAFVFALVLASPKLCDAQAAPKKITSVEGITEYRLDNGLKVLIFPDQSKPTITVNITYKVGSRFEGYGESGMAHLLEHMVFKGSSRHKDIPAELTSHGASPNGTTWYDRTNYFETFQATDENLKWALDLEADRMVNSFIKPEDLASEFTVVRNEFEMGENSPSSVLMERILSSAYLWHNYGKSTIGSKEDIERVPVPNLRAFYTKYYQPDNAVLLVAGKIDEAKTLGWINQYFGKIPKPTRVLQPTYTVEPTQDGERFVELKRTGDVQTVACAYHIPSGSHPDYPAIDVLNEVLNNEPSGRLYQGLVKTGKASSVWGWAASLHDPGFIYFNTDVLKEKSLDEAQNTMFRIFDELKTKPVTQSEVDKARAKLLKDYETVFRNSGRVGILLSEFIAMGDWRLAFLYRDGLKKVTVDDVNRVATKYIINSNRTYGRFEPTKDAQRAEIPNTPDVAKMVEGYKGEETMKAGEAFDASTTNIDERSELVKMETGPKYYLLTKSTRGETVEGRITLRIGDEANMFGKSAVAGVTADMLMRGTTQRSQAQINEELDRLKSTLRIGGGGQVVSIVFQSTRENLPKLLTLIEEILHQPAFAQQEFKTLIDENIANLEQSRSEPMAIAGREFGAIGNHFPKGHILAHRTLDEEIAGLKNLTTDDLKTFYKNYYNGSSATAAFVGDFDATVVKQAMDKMMANWSAIKSFSHIDNPHKAFKAESKAFKTPDKKNAMMICGQEFSMKDDNPDYAALVMGNFIFGGGFLNSRLANRIRQKDGLSYGVGSFFNAGTLDANATLGAYAIYNPENKDKLIAAFKEELNKLIATGVTQDELDAAKNGIIQSRENGRAQDAALAGKLNSNAYYERTMAWDQKIDDQLQALTVAQVNSAISKYIKADQFSFVVAGDFK